MYTLYGLLVLTITMGSIRVLSRFMQFACLQSLFTLGQGLPVLNKVWLLGFHLCLSVWLWHFTLTFKLVVCTQAYIVHLSMTWCRTKQNPFLRFISHCFNLCVFPISHTLLCGCNFARSVLHPTASGCFS